MLPIIRSSTPYQVFLKGLRDGKQYAGLGLPRAARLPVAANLYADLKWPVLLVRTCAS